MDVDPDRRAAGNILADLGFAVGRVEVRDAGGDDRPVVTATTRAAGGRTTADRAPVPVHAV